MTVTAPGSAPMTIDRTQAGHQTGYVLRYGGTESCMLTYGAAEMAPAVWKILLPGPGGTNAIYGTEQFRTPDAGRLRSWLASVVGPAHESELEYLFTLSNTAYPGGLIAPQEQLAATMKTYWTNFAESSDPASPSTPRWPRFTTTGQQILSLNPPRLSAETTFAAEHRCAFWAYAGSGTP